ncbi:hypothetical protein GGI05_007413 [Coemansia sp. RSA 2603]|nr:hypothetical protein GGI05_007413 [Coemansia sp. RSA 2603]
MENYFTPSQEYVNDLGLQLSVGKALMLDTGVVCGTGSSSGSLGGLIKKTNKLVTEDDINEGDEELLTITNGDTEYKISEYKWLDLFLQIIAKTASDGEDNAHVKSYKYIIENNT